MDIIPSIAGRFPTWVTLAALAVPVTGFWIICALRRSSLACDLNFPGYLGLLATLAAMLMINLNGIRVAPSVSISDVLLVAAAMLLALSFLLSDRPPTPGIVSLVLIGCLPLGSAVISTMLGRLSDFTDNGLVSIELGIALLLLPAIVSKTADSPERLIALAAAWVFSAATNGFVGCLDMLGISHLGMILNPNEGLAGRFSALTTHVNMLGMTCAMTLPVGIWLAVAAKSMLKCALYGFAVLAIGAGILVSGSRGSTLAAALGLLLLVRLRPNTRRTIIVSGLVLGLIGAAATTSEGIDPQLAFSAIYRVSGRVSGEASDLTRLHEARVALASLNEYPIFGQGYKYIHGPDSYYLGLLEAGGLFGLISYVVFECWATYTVWSAIGCGRDGLLDGFAEALFASLLVFFSSGLVENAFYDRSLYVPVGLILALRAVQLGVSDSARTSGRVSRGTFNYEDKND